MDYLIGSLALNLLVLFNLFVVLSNTLGFSLDLTLFVLSFLCIEFCPEGALFCVAF